MTRGSGSALSLPIASILASKSSPPSLSTRARSSAVSLGGSTGAAIVGGSARTSSIAAKKK